MKQSHTNVSVNELDETTQENQVRVWRERILTDDDLFHGTDEAGRVGWFLRLSLTGMYPRRIGPYHTKTEALSVLDGVAAEFVMDTLTNIQSDLESHQTCIQEGVAPLAATAHACV